MLTKYMLLHPTVFACGDKYQIFVSLSEDAVMKVRVGDEIYYDHINGILRSATKIHKVEIPMELLNREKRYTVCYKRILERKPYFPPSEEWIEFTVDFRPVKEDGDINIYHISDSHTLSNEAIKAGSYFGDKLDLLILNGDIPDESNTPESFDEIFKISSVITEGKIPVVYARGNHDTRGSLAEFMSYNIPTLNGKTYYTFRLGCIWGIVLDCGEDKLDTNAEYNETTCFHIHRLEQTEFIKDVIKNSAFEYNAPGIKHRLLISHIVFSYCHREPFNIETELYTEWSKLIRENIKPDLSLHGHYHKTEICPVGSWLDSYGQPATAIIGGKPSFDKNNGNSFTGCALTLKENGLKKVVFNDSCGNILSEEII